MYKFCSFERDGFPEVKLAFFMPTKTHAHIGYNTVVPLLLHGIPNRNTIRAEAKWN